MDTINTTGTGSSSSFTNYCANRLPCGMCRLTMSFCPLWNGCGGIHWGEGKPYWTEVTCQSTEGSIK